MQKAMDLLVEEFNDTKGKELGIIVNITAINSSATLQEKLLAFANGELGAAELPNITTCYPNTAIILLNKKLLVNLEDYFTKKELDLYVPSFIEEGRINEGLYVFPVAKSSEVLFVNRTLFDRFAAATGAKISDLATFEGIVETAKKYYQYSKGKSLYMADSLFNLVSVDMKQLGDNFIVNNELNLSSKNYLYIYDLLSKAYKEGYFQNYKGYSSDLQKTGEILISTGSTAGILYYGDTVTYPNNTTEHVKYDVIPYPTFNGGKKIAIQRGNGMVITSSDKQKEYASSIFLKWFSEEKQNMRFIAKTGYLPVTKSAFEAVIKGDYQNSDNENITKLLNTAVKMYQDYEFYIPPVFDKYDSLSKKWLSEFNASLNKK